MPVPETTSSALPKMLPTTVKVSEKAPNEVGLNWSERFRVSKAGMTCGVLSVNAKGAESPPKYTVCSTPTVLTNSSSNTVVESTVVAVKS